MKKVILIGDSIRMGYQDTVAQLLAGDAQLDFPPNNGGTSANVLAHLDEWAIDKLPDVVHINAGLHDLARDGDEQGNPRIAIATYEQNVRTILSRLRDETHAVVIWALCTPVNERLHHENKAFDRFEDDVAQYNAAARRAAEQMNVPINDLYQFVMDAGRDGLLNPDGVHFTDEGKRLLGERVSQVVRALVASSPPR
jgi:lysophospholipase L1-like esterase